MITDAERERIQGLSLAAQWAELQMQLPGLVYGCEENTRNCYGCGDFGVCQDCAIPDLALLLTAMQQAGWWYSIFGGKVGCIVEFMKLTVNPHAQDGTRWIGATNPDVTAAAVGAACRALAAEKGTNHVGQEKA